MYARADAARKVGHKIYAAGGGVNFDDFRRRRRRRKFPHLDEEESLLYLHTHLLRSRAHTPRSLNGQAHITFINIKEPAHQQMTNLQLGRKKTTNFNQQPALSSRKKVKYKFLFSGAARCQQSSEICGFVFVSARDIWLRQTQLLGLRADSHRGGAKDSRLRTGPTLLLAELNLY